VTIYNIRIYKVLFEPGMKKRYISIFCISLFVHFTLFAQQAPKHPDIVVPGIDGKPPSDALVLFDKHSLGNFESVKGGPAMWIVKGKKFYVQPETGNIQTKKRFGDVQLHIEWKTPKKDVKEGKTGQKNGNSGIYLMGKYEVQVLNSFLNETGADGQAGAIYNQHAPLVNASLPPGKWQTYDIIFKAPKYGEGGVLLTPGYMTLFHNGVLVQDHSEIKEPTPASSEQFEIVTPKLPLMLQDHKSRVSYRNIWIRNL